MPVNKSNLLKVMMIDLARILYRVQILFYTVKMDRPGRFPIKDPLHVPTGSACKVKHSEHPTFWAMSLN